MSGFHDHYMKQWMEMFNVTSPWGVVEHLINLKNNYDTAVAIMFDLSWFNPEHKLWLRRASDELKKTHAQYNKVPLDANYLYNWQAYYLSDVEALPTTTENKP